MKSIYKIFLLALGVNTFAFSQIAEITRLPVQDISQSIKESEFQIYHCNFHDFITSKKMMILR